MSDKLKLVYTVLVLAALVYAERRLIEPRLTGARLSALVQEALVYKVLVYQEWHQLTPPPVSYAYDQGQVTMVPVGSSSSTIGFTMSIAAFLWCKLEVVIGRSGNWAYSSLLL